MELRVHQIKDHRICEVVSENVVINNLQDALDLLGNSSFFEAYKIIIKQNQLCPEFFDLKTCLAGDILQKFSTYNLQLAIIGDFENLESKSLRNFIRESNKIGRILFVGNSDEAKEKLAR